MSVSDKDPVYTYSGNGSNKIFEFDCLINTTDELIVQHTDSNGVQNTLILNTDYSINEVKNENGSYITFPLASSTYSILSSTEKITLSLDLKFIQEVEYSKSGGLSFLALENSLDYLTRMAQILRRKIERCVKVKEGSGVNPDDLITSLEASALAASGSATAAALSQTAAANSAATATTQATAAAASAEEARIAAQQLENSSVTFTATIGTTWSGSSAPFTQAVSVVGVLAADNPIVALVQSDTYATALTQLGEFSKIYRAVTSADTITFYANEPTASALSVQIKTIR